MREIIALFLCWMMYAIAKKQQWIDPGPEAPAWAGVAIFTLFVVGVVAMVFIVVGKGRRRR